MAKALLFSSVLHYVISAFSRKDLRDLDPDKLARQLMLLTEGAIITAYVSGDPDAGRRVKRIAADLINASCAVPVDA